MNERNIKSKQQNMLVKDLKKILKELPDDMPIVIPVIDEDDCNRIFGFRFVRTAGLLTCEFEENSNVLCLNASKDGMDIVEQVFVSGKDVDVAELLFW